MLKFFEKEKEIVAAMSEKKDGQMKLFGKEYIKNRKNFLEKFGVNLKNVVSAKLCHGKKVKIVRDNKQKIIFQTDGLVTEKPGIFLAVTVADCVPVLFFEKKKKIIGVVHAGWRSTVKNIAEVAVKKIKKLSGETKNITVEIGPAIKECHFEIGKEILPRFKEYQKFVKIKKGKYFVDLKGILKEQLIKNGISQKNIKVSGVCTFCDKKYFSARRDNNKDIQAGMAIIGMK